MKDRNAGLIGFLRSMARILSGRPRIPRSVKDNTSLALILNRRSVRSFSRKEIPVDILDAILEAGRLAPSTVNLQTWSFAVFTPTSWPETFDRPIPLNGNRALVIMSDTHRIRLVLDAFPRSPLVEYTIGVMNASLAAMNITIAAEALGVSSVMLSETGRTGLLDCGYLRQRLELPDGVVPLTTIILGYRQGPRLPMPPRLPLDQVSFAGRYKEASEAVMADWLAQMKAGYKASHPLSSFEAQLQLYASKIEQAEEDLKSALSS